MLTQIEYVLPLGSMYSIPGFIYLIPFEDIFHY